MSVSRLRQRARGIGALIVFPPVRIDPQNCPTFLRKTPKYLRICPIYEVAISQLPLEVLLFPGQVNLIVNAP